MKKIEVLAWGVQHIASNHDANWSTDYEEYQSMSLMGDNVPTLSDARMLCEDVGLDASCCYADHSWGIIVFDVEGWADTIGQEEYVSNPAKQMWKRYGVEIGSEIN